MNSAAILAFLDAVAADGLELHGLMVWRAGAVVAEGFWRPYAAHRPHLLHSAAKSWTAAAVGLAIADGLLRLEDRVADLFPEHRPDPAPRNLAAITVADLLTMRSGHRATPPDGTSPATEGSWVSAFFRMPVPDPPGTVFAYGSAASHMLSAIVTRVTGQTVHDLLRQRLFRPMGMTEGTWDRSPDGDTTGGNGLSCTLEDVLKFGVLHLSGGRWNGAQVFPASWVAATLHSHVASTLAAPTDAPTRQEGFGYNWWVTPGGAARTYGMFGQQCLLLPAQQAVIAMTAALAPGDKRLMRHVGQRLIPALGTHPPDPAADRRLAARLASLALPSPAGVPTSRIQAAVSGARYVFAPNEDGALEVTLTFGADTCRLVLHDARGTHAVLAGLTDPIEGDTTMSGAPLHFAHQPGMLRVVASATWLDPQCLCHTWRFVETAFCDTLLCRFAGDTIRLDRRVNVNKDAVERPTLVGVLAPAPPTGKAPP